MPKQQNQPPFWRHNWPAKQLLLSSYHLSPKNLPAYLKILEEFQPEIIDGYPSAIHIVAEHIRSTTGIALFRPCAIVTSAETLLPHQRQTIETVFLAKVYNQYSSSEGAPFVSECKAGQLHVHLDSGVIEILKTDGAPAQPGELGEMVVTSFTSHVTPLLRLAIGDVAIPAKEKIACECGLPFPVLDMIVGRLDDILYTPDRGFVGRLDTVFKTLPNSIIEAQIVQVALERVVLRFVPDRSRYRPEHANLVIEEMRRRLGQVVEIQAEEVGHIPRSANGKMRAVINLCSEILPVPFLYAERGSKLIRLEEGSTHP